jgi:hypothetical protein
MVALADFIRYVALERQAAALEERARIVASDRERRELLADAIATRARMLQLAEGTA